VVLAAATEDDGLGDGLHVELVTRAALPGTLQENSNVLMRNRFGGEDCVREGEGCVGVRQASQSLGGGGRREHRVVILPVCRQHVQQVLVETWVGVWDDGGWVGRREKTVGGRLHGLQDQLVRAEAGGEDGPQGGEPLPPRAGDDGRVHHHGTDHHRLLLGGLLCVGQGGDLVVLQSHGGEGLQVAGVVTLDVLGQVAFVAEPFKTGGEETAEWLLAGVFPFVRVELGLGEETFPTALAEQLVVS
jgi:hypothetical protein